MTASEPGECRSDDPRRDAEFSLEGEPITELPSYFFVAECVTADAGQAGQIALSCQPHLVTPPLDPTSVAVSAPESEYTLSLPGDAPELPGGRTVVLSAFFNYGCGESEWVVVRDAETGDLLAVASRDFGLPTALTSGADALRVRAGRAYTCESPNPDECFPFEPSPLYVAADGEELAIPPHSARTVELDDRSYYLENGASRQLRDIGEGPDCVGDCIGPYFRMLMVRDGL